jgi:hypothetical protein
MIERARAVRVPGGLSFCRNTYSAYQMGIADYGSPDQLDGHTSTGDRRQDEYAHSVRNDTGR